WLFIIESLPSLIAGFATMMFLQDSPRKAKWLDEQEKALLLARLDSDDPHKRKHHSIAGAFRSAKTWLLCAVYFGFVMGNYGIYFWLPQIVKDTITKDSLAIGILTAIPYAAAAIAMVIIGHHSDVTGERRWHIGLAGILSAAAFVMSAWPGISGIGCLAALTVATAANACAYSTFWALPTSILGGAAASAGIAWINSVGNLAGYVSPFLVGKIRDTVHSTTPALLAIAASVLVSALITVIFFRTVKSEQTSVSS
ncbi:MAG: MFS transporter, partial [Acidobacteriaceae bacterium]|nr:MFS transporter [Acidobacteriaceae bacterium]